MKTKRPSVIVLEDLNVSGMIKNHCLAKAISDAGWSIFRQFVSYKAEREGVRIEIADRFFPSSKMCSRCGNVKDHLDLSERTYHCDVCGLVIDRDLNASYNLRDYHADWKVTVGETESAHRDNVNPRPQRGSRRRSGKLVGDSPVNL